MCIFCWRSLEKGDLSKLFRGVLDTTRPWIQMSYTKPYIIRKMWVLVPKIYSINFYFWVKRFQAYFWVKVKLKRQLLSPEWNCGTGCKPGVLQERYNFFSATYLDKTKIWREMCKQKHNEGIKMWTKWNDNLDIWKYRNMSEWKYEWNWDSYCVCSRYGVLKDIYNLFIFILGRCASCNQNISIWQYEIHIMNETVNAAKLVIFPSHIWQPIYFIKTCKCKKITWEHMIRNIWMKMIRNV